MKMTDEHKKQLLIGIGVLAVVILAIYVISTISAAKKDARETVDKIKAADQVVVEKKVAKALHGFKSFKNNVKKEMKRLEDSTQQDTGNVQ